MKVNYFEVYYEMFKNEKTKVLKSNGIVLYSMMSNQVGLSKKAENVKKYTDKNGEVFILFTERNAKDKLGISKKTFFELKKMLKELGLINYEKQAIKKNGVSTPIYVTPFDVWLKSEYEKIQEDKKYDLPDFH